MLNVFFFFNFFYFSSLTTKAFVYCRNFRNDIAVLLLKRRIHYSNLIRPICLINVEDRDYEFVHPEKCVITGYGDIGKYNCLSLSFIKVIGVKVGLGSFVCQGTST